MKTIVLVFIALFLHQHTIAQSIAINTSGAPPHASAMVDVSSTLSGFLFPRMTTSERLAISSPAVGLMVYDTQEQGIWMFTDGGWTTLTQYENSPFVKSGNDIHYVGGNVTIGNTVLSPLLFDYQDIISSTGTYMKIINTASNSHASLSLGGPNRIYRMQASSGTQKLNIVESNSGWVSLTFHPSGNISSQEASPVDRLHIDGTLKANVIQCQNINFPYISMEHLVVSNFVNVGPYVANNDPGRFNVRSVNPGYLVDAVSSGVGENTGELRVNNKVTNVAPVKIFYHNSGGVVQSRIESAVLRSKNTQLGYAGLAGNIRTFGSNGLFNCLVGRDTYNANHGFAGVGGTTNNLWGFMYVNEQGDGVFAFSIKNFVMDFPGRSNQEIWYASLEGPEAAAYTRGTGTLTNGRAEIHFPDHFALLANSETMTVIITPLNEYSKGLAVTSKSATGFVVEELANGTGTYEFDWEVKCVRKGYEDFRVIREKRTFDFAAN